MFSHEIMLDLFGFMVWSQMLKVNMKQQPILLLYCNELLSENRYIMGKYGILET